jgi:hypothetical protein
LYVIVHNPSHSFASFDFVEEATSSNGAAETANNNKMDNVNEDSVNSVTNEQTAEGIPNDGTGIVIEFLEPEIQLILPGVVKLDPWLSPFKNSLKSRFAKAQKWIKTIDETEGGLEKFSRVGQLPYLAPADADQSRAQRSSDSTWTNRTTLPIGNGRPMRRKHSLLVTLVLLLPQ